VSHPVVHWEIGGRDTEALRDFYARAFGWKIVEVDPNFSLVRPSGGGLGGGLARTPEGVPPYVTIYVQVGDLDTALIRIKGLGGTALAPPTQIDEKSSFALFRDPEGNVVGLFETTLPIDD